MTLEEVSKIITTNGPKAHEIVKRGVRTFQEVIFVGSFNNMLKDCLIVTAFYDEIFEAGVIPTPSQITAMAELTTFLKSNGYWVEKGA